MKSWGFISIFFYFPPLLLIKFSMCISGILLFSWQHLRYSTCNGSTHDVNLPPRVWDFNFLKGLITVTAAITDLKDKVEERKCLQNGLLQILCEKRKGSKLRKSIFVNNDVLNSFVTATEFYSILPYIQPLLKESFLETTIFKLRVKGTLRDRSR